MLEIKLKDLQFFDCKVGTWKFIEMFNHVRLYYHPQVIDAKKGFYFYAVEAVSCSFDSDSLYSDDNVQVTCICKGEADKERIYSLSLGYGEYHIIIKPDLSILTNIFSELSKLESKYCTKEIT